MIRRTIRRGRVYAVVLAFVVAALAGGAAAAEIKGTVTALQEGRIRIELEGSLRPRVGDRVRITWKLGERVLEAGRAKIDEVGAGFAMARVTEGNPNIEMQATVQSNGAEAPSKGAEAAPPAQPSPGPAAGVSRELRVVQTSWPIGKGRWGWEIHLEGPAAALDRVRSVRYRLHPTFPDPDRTVDTRENGFKLSTDGWGTFTVHIEISYEDGRKEPRQHRLKFTTRSK